MLVKESIKRLQNGNFKIIYKIIRWGYSVFYDLIFGVLYIVCRPIPLKNKIVASSFSGRIYGDNTKVIVEELHKLNPYVEIVWLKDPDCIYETPEYIKCVPCYDLKHTLRRYYEYATAKVWISTHHLDLGLKKRKNQIFIETWHGGLGIKRMELDAGGFENDYYQNKKIRNTTRNADLFISNSIHLTSLYRRAFKYSGIVWRCGYPKNDYILNDSDYWRNMIRKQYSIEPETKIMMYAPTFRESFEQGGIVDYDLYKMDFDRVIEALNNNWGGNWIVFVRWHPIMVKATRGRRLNNHTIIDVSEYPNMQELIMASDAFITDYSSGIFDAALREIPCLTFALDYYSYSEERGTYADMNSLPFPFADSNEQLITNIKEFSLDDYVEEWYSYANKEGLVISNHSGKDIAQVINNFLLDNKNWKEKVVDDKI